MNFKELWNASLRDLKKNPRKIAILGLLAVTAMYFWVPLVKKWTAGGSGGAEPDTQAMMAQFISGGGDAAPAPVGQTTEETPWSLIAEEIQTNPWTKPLAALELGHDPFAPPPKDEPHTADDDEPASLAEKQAEEAAELGLELSATSIGTLRRAAIINDKAYRPGNTIEDVKGNTWTIVEIEARHVVLSRGDKTLRLLAPRTLADELRERNLAGQRAGP